MQRILIFAGTTEGRELSETLDEAGLYCEVRVATEYGRELMPEGDRLHVGEGRLTEGEMEALMRQGDFLAVVDATHPYAVEVTEHIRGSAARVGLPYLRLKRDTKTEREAAEPMSDIRYVDSAADCIRVLKGLPGNILLTTGSKELWLYMAEPSLRDRLYVRVLPGIESLMVCKEQGLSGKQIIAMQGPFSEELNEALMTQLDISVLVTKESGHAGGFLEKIRAAERRNIPVIVLQNPEKDEGYTSEEVLAQLAHLAEHADAAEDEAACMAEHADAVGDEAACMAAERTDAYEITLLGVGMGNPDLLTVEAKRAIAQADVLFGAKRLLLAVSGQKKPEAETVDAYRPEQILPRLEELQKSRPAVKAALLFSGDPGFYSGADAVHGAVRQALAAGRLRGTLTICPGISSLSYLAARTGKSWQDARIMSIHGKEADVAGVVRSERQVFLIMSGADDMRKVAAELAASGLGGVRLTVGYQMSYPGERIFEITPRECAGLYEEGLYACIIENPANQSGCESAEGIASQEPSVWGWEASLPNERYMTHGFPDSYFIRGEVPMTKEEVREVSLCKLRLTEDAVFYDIGSGTGSIAVEAARLSNQMRVYAVERRQDAQELIQKNAKKANVTNLHLVAGEAPECLAMLPVPTHVFIGGSGGRLKELLACLYERNPDVRVVLNAISLETAAELTTLFTEMPISGEEIVQLSVGRAKRAGGYHLMRAENPVYIVSFTFSKSDGETCVEESGERKSKAEETGAKEKGAGNAC